MPMTDFIYWVKVIGCVQKLFKRICYEFVACYTIKTDKIIDDEKD